MRSANAAFLSAIAGATESGIDVRRSLTIWPKEWDTGDVVEIGLWTGDDPITTSVMDGETGGTVSRSFIGGVDLAIPAIPRTSGLTIQTFEITMSQIADAVQTVMRTYDARMASAEIHEWILDASGAPVSPPESVWLGVVDEGGLETPAAGAEGRVRIVVVSEPIRMLTRKNPRKRSDEGQKRRSGDRFARYSNSAGYTMVYWGENAPPKAGNPNGGDRLK